MHLTTYCISSGTELLIFGWETDALVVVYPVELEHAGVQQRPHGGRVHGRKVFPQRLIRLPGQVASVPSNDPAILVDQYARPNFAVATRPAFFAFWTLKYKMLGKRTNKTCDIKPIEKGYWRSFIEKDLDRVHLPIHARMLSVFIRKFIVCIMMEDFFYIWDGFAPDSRSEMTETKSTIAIINLFVIPQLGLKNSLYLDSITVTTMCV